MKLTRFRYRDHKTGKIVRGVKIREQSKPSAPKGRRSAIISKAGLYNEVAAADYVGLSVSRLQNRRCERLPPRYEKHGRSVWYRRDALDEFKASRHRDGTVTP